MGTLLAGRYRLARHLATGGMGQVWAADDLVLHRRVAVKVLRDDLAERDDLLERFEHEARHAASVIHPNIATLHDFVRDESTPRPRSFLVMELVDGEPLSALLRRTPTPPLDTTLRILAQSADALAAAHRGGVVHRDVKPANILLDHDGEVRLTDFGIAGPVDDASPSARTEVLGTPHYMSPEQAKGEPVTPRSDLYSLGVVAFRMLSGRLPIDGATPAAVMEGHLHRLPPPLPDGVPSALHTLVASALAKSPDDRPADAAAFAGALRSVSTSSVDDPTVVVAANDEPTAVLPAAMIAPTRRRVNVVFWAVAAVVAAAALALSVGGGDEGEMVPETIVPATTVAPGSTVMTVVATPTTTAAAPPAASPGNGNGRGNGNGKDKDKGKGNGG